MFIVVLLITYWFLKRKLPNMVGGRFAKVISKVYIDRSTSLVLVRILKEYYVILIGPNKAEVIQKLDTIDEGEIEKPEDFQSVLNKYVGGKK
ncbi:MAG TPA: flagellar biosynthetic protein FliO [Fervidobacterium sp.]|nr:flagellar biosynthetic protein FliO [Fervidobacterium sp.]HOH53043.1 flagellar biosynthetic protein FliO [Fervidobacterium sp.]HOK33188.1 flagellar biosynthetic protein FliO [Fervidobacterium sp.]HOL03053.1 flagellar biosynthetic protein FliO [Fervidobacterium sp.]HON03375.1 flagellar biosynthetic protein FliO [Fervidobacterium sp.]